MEKSIVGVYHEADMTYDVKPPYNPPEIYPEYPYDSFGTDSRNLVYTGVRNMFRVLGMDAGNFNTKNWNPLGVVIKPGDNVLIKPAFTVDRHPELGVEGVSSIITNASVLRPLVDYAYIALKGRGRITIADGSIECADFNKLLQVTGTGETVKHLCSKYKVPLDIVDLRDEYLRRNRVSIGSFGVELTYPRKLAGDPRGYTIVDLETDSELSDIVGGDSRFKSVQTWNKYVPGEHHTKNKNEYSIPNTVLDSDVVINVPKLKVHRKAGVTLSLKNMVGITNKKSWLPHHREGKQPVGDEYPQKPPLRIRIVDIIRSLNNIRHVVQVNYGKGRILKKTLSKKNVIQEGDWYGNDTVYRMVLDLNKILFYSDKNGVMQSKKQRRYFTILDGIICGEGEGPLHPTPKRCGMLVAGFDPVAVDTVATTLMGFDPRKIPKLRRAGDIKKYPLGVNDLREINVVSEPNRLPKFRFTPASGWIGHIEA